jgi:hypothetical protein
MTQCECEELMPSLGESNQLQLPNTEPAKFITQEQALEFARNNPEALTPAYSAGKRLYIGVDISDLGPGEQFSYLNPKDAPKATLGADGVTRITILDGAPLETVKAGLADSGHEFNVFPKGKYDQTVQIEVKGLSPEKAQGLMRDISYTSQTVTNAGPDSMVNAIQASVSDAQAKEVLEYWRDQGRTQADYRNLVNKIADIQVRDGAAIGDVYDDKMAKLGNNRLVSGNDIAEAGGFAGDGNYVRGQQEVRIVASDNYVLEGAGSKSDQYVNGKGILIYELNKEGEITSVRSSAADHATSNGNFLDANGKALTTLEPVKPAAPEHIIAAKSMAAGAQASEALARTTTHEESVTPEVYKPSGGEDLSEAFRSAQKLAESSGKPVSMNFNDVPLHITADSEFADVKSQFAKSMTPEVYKPYDGQDFGDAFSQARKLASTLGTTVSMTHNGVPLQITADSKYVDAQREHFSIGDADPGVHRLQVDRTREILENASLTDIQIQSREAEYTQKAVARIVNNDGYSPEAVYQALREHGDKYGFSGGAQSHVENYMDGVSAKYRGPESVAHERQFNQASSALESANLKDIEAGTTTHTQEAVKNLASNPDIEPKVIKEAIGHQATQRLLDLDPLATHEPVQKYMEAASDQFTVERLTKFREQSMKSTGTTPTEFGKHQYTGNGPDMGVMDQPLSERMGPPRASVQDSQRMNEMLAEDAAAKTPAPKPAAATPVESVAGASTETAKATNSAPEVGEARAVGGSGARAGAAAYGVVTGTMELESAIKRGDKGDMVSAGTKLGVSAAETSLHVAEAAGAEVSPALTGAVGKAFVPLMVADGIYQVSKEDGLTHKAERAAAVVGTGGAAIGTGSLVSSALTAAGVSGTTATAAAATATGTEVAVGAATATGAVAAGGTVATVATVAAPLVAGGAVAYMAGKDIETGIETRRTYEKTDAMFTANLDSKSNMVRLGNARFHDELADRETGQIDWNNKETMQKYGKLLDGEAAKQTKLMDDNSSIMPRFLRSGESVIAQENARVDLRITESARTELNQHMTDLAKDEPKQAKEQKVADLPDEHRNKLDAQLSGVNLSGISKASHAEAPAPQATAIAKGRQQESGLGA